MRQIRMVRLGQLYNDFDLDPSSGKWRRDGVAYFASVQFGGLVVLREA